MESRTNISNQLENLVDGSMWHISLDTELKARNNRAFIAAILHISEIFLDGDCIFNKEHISIIFQCNHDAYDST